MREIVEELECSEQDFQVAPEPFVTLKFREFSKAALVETDYEWQVFVTELSDSLLGQLQEICTWVIARNKPGASQPKAKPASSSATPTAPSASTAPPSIEFCRKKRES